MYVYDVGVVLKLLVKETYVNLFICYISKAIIYAKIKLQISQHIIYLKKLTA